MSLNRIPRHQAECGDYVRRSTSLPQINKSWLEKIDVMTEEKGKPLNAMKCGQLRMKVRSVSNLDLPTTSSLDVERRRRFSESDKSTVEQEEKPTVVVEFGEAEMKVIKSTADVELMQSSASSSENVTSRRRQNDSAKSTTQLADRSIEKNVYQTRSLDRNARNKHDKHREWARWSISWPAQMNVANVEQEKTKKVMTGGEARTALKSASCVELSQMSAASSRRLRHSQSTLSLTHSTQLTADKGVFLDHISQYQTERNDYVSSTTSVKEQWERVDKCWLATTKEEKGKSANVVDSAGLGMLVKSASNLELTQMNRASSRDVRRLKRRLSDSDMSRTSCKHLASPTSQHGAFHSNSFDRISMQYRTERSEYYRSKQPEPEEEHTRLTKIGMTKEEQRKPTNPVGAEVGKMKDKSASNLEKIDMAEEEQRKPTNPAETELSTMKYKSASNLDLTQTHAEATPDAQRRQRFIKLKKSAMSHTRLAAFTSRKNVFRNRSLRRTPHYRAERDDYVGSTTSLTEQRERLSWLEKIDMAVEEQKKPTDPAETELPTMKYKSASNLDLTQTPAEAIPDTQRRQRFIRLKKSSTRIAGFTSRKNMFRNRSLRHIPRYRAERDNYVGSTTSLTERPSDRSWLEKIDISNEQTEQRTNVVELGQPRMTAVKSASTFDLRQTSTCRRRRRRLSDSEKSTVSRKSTVSLASVQHLTGRVTEPALFYAISLEHIPVDRDSDYGSVTSQSDKSWLAKKMRQRMSKMMIYRLFLDSVFVLFAVSTLLTAIGFVVPYVFLPNRGLRLGFDSSQSSWLISAVGISNTIGRFVFGFIASMKHVNSLMLYSSMLVVCGICSLFSVLLITFPLQMCYALCFGFLSSKS